MRHFHTLSKAIANSPSDLNNAYTSQTFRWKYQRGLTNVHIQLDTCPTFNSPIVKTYNSSGSNQDYCYHSISEMLFGATYYWRVRSYHSRDTTEWSDPLSFRTYNFCSLSSPADSATNLYTTLQLRFKYSNGVSRYQMQLDTCPTFDSPLLNDHIESASSQDYAYGNYSNLLFGTTYYWRVRECHAKDTTQWSATRRFTTYDFCKLRTPSDSATNIITSPKLAFEYNTGVNRYQMQLDTCPTFDSPLLNDHIESASSQDYAYANYSNLLFGTTYYWRVRECHTKDTTKWSPIRQFTTYYCGSLSSPANGATGISVTPRLKFVYQTGISNYVLQVDTTADFTSELLLRKSETANSSTYAYWQVSETLLYGTTYYWQMQHVHPKDTSDWTSPWSFTTAYQLPQPTLLTPANQEVVSHEGTTFTWQAMPSALRYVFQIADNGQFAPIMHQETLTETSTSMTLPEGQVLYWRIQAIDQAGRSPWSAIRSVTSTSIGTSLDEIVGGNEDGKFVSNGQVLIRHNGKVYNVLGQEK